MSVFANRQKTDVSFIVRNTDQSGRVLKIFNQKIGWQQEYDLLSIPGISVDDILTSIHKGDLGSKIRNGQIVVIFSDINNNENYKEFLALKNIDPKSGPSSGRPIDPIKGQQYYDTTLSAHIEWTGLCWSLAYPGASSAGFSVFEEWIGTGGSGPGFLGWETLGSASRSNPNTVDSKHIGVLQFAVGSSSSLLRVNAPTPIIFSDVESVYMETMFNINTLSDSSQGYIFRIGTGNSNVGSTDHNNGIYFEYNHSTSDNWLACTANSGDRTKVDTGIPVQADPSWVKLVYVYDGVGAHFSVNDGPVTSVLSTLPTTGATGIAGYYFHRTAGSTSRNFWLDYCTIKVLMNRMG